MTDWIDSVTKIVNAVSGMVWGLPLIVAILATGIILSVAMHFRHLLNKYF